MFFDKYFASKLMLGTTASISKNAGFSTSKSSSLHMLNDLLIKFLEHLAKELRKIAEMRGADADVSPEDVIAMLMGMNFSTNELSHYLNSVADFPFLSAMPIFPIQSYQEQKNDANFTIDITAALGPAERIVDVRRNFPNFVGKSWRQLQLNRCLADIEMNGTLDSLASPFMDLRRMPSKKKAKETFSGNTLQPENKDKKEDREKGLKSVLSKKGLTLRLLNFNANTPPGFFSSRSRTKEETGKK